MKTLSEIASAIDEILATDWVRRAGQQIPTTEDVKLGNDAVELDGAVLYADLVESTALVNSVKDSVAAEMYKVYLYSACELIRNNGGQITAFDGDRVMGVFIGEKKDDSAAKCALQINHVVRKTINPKILETDPKLSYVMRQTVGIDSGKLFVARTGIRGSNDLVWVGRAANLAAKLCELRDDCSTSYLTIEAYRKLSEGMKFAGTPRQSIWTKFQWSEMGVEAYRSNWSCTPA